MKDYNKSIYYYASLDMKGMKDCRIFFNLALAYEKLNQLDMALMNYDKVKKQTISFSNYFPF